VIKRVNVLLNEEYKGKNVQVLCLGKKVTDAFRRSLLRAENKAYGTEDIFADLKFNHAAEIAENVMKAYLSKQFDEVVIVYNSFVNAANQVVKTEQFLPIIPTVSEGSTSTGDYIFEPSKEEIVEELIPKSLKIQFYKSLLDSNASEHGARMTAMHKATDNAKDLQKSLKLSYNKARQAAITNEILEIVGGAEALNG
jgi:F-type H+-transporting ATPase subunit gamma